MSYTKTTDFASKDVLVAGDPLKLIRGSEIGAEFDAIQTADALNMKSATLAATGGSDLVGFIQAGTGASTSLTVQDKLRETVSVKDFGAVGDGSTDDTSAIQAAIDSVYSAGGGELFFPPATYRVQNLQAKDRVKCVGVFGATTLKVVDGVDNQVFYNPDQSIPITVDYFGLEGLICDGNKAADAGLVASSAVAVNGVTYFYAKDCIFQNATGYGLAFQAYPGGALSGAQTEIYLENCHFLNNGDGVGGDTFDGLDIKDCDVLTMVGCTAEGNADKGINIRGEKVSIFGGHSVSNGADGYFFQGNTNLAAVATVVKVQGCEARSNGGAGFGAANGAGGATQVVRVSLNGITSAANLYGIELPAGASLVELTTSDAHVFGNTDHGVIVSSSPMACLIRGSVIRSNGGSGVYTNAAKVQISDCQINLNTRYGIEEGGSATRTVVAGASYVQSNTLGQFLFNSNGRHMVGRGVLDFDLGVSGGDIIASASTITLPQGGDVFFITGTTTIATITASRRGRIVVLHFTGVLTVDHAAGNIRLSSGVDKTTANRHQLMLMCDGTSWYEVAYSANI